MNKNKVLIVEDESIIAMELQQKLNLWGYPDPVAVASGEKALKICAKIKPDIILVDIKLQGKLDGIKTVHEIKKISDIPVIYITSFLDKDITNKAIETRPYSYLMKPLNMDEVKINIDLALERHKHLEKVMFQTKNQTTEDIYTFISSFILPLTINIPIYKRNEYLLKFTDQLKGKYKTEFRKEVKKLTEKYGKDGDDIRFESCGYLVSLASFLNRIGFYHEIINKGHLHYMITSKCPWKLEKSQDNFLCLICQLILKESIKWSKIHCSVNHNSSMLNGYENCVFEFNFD